MKSEDERVSEEAGALEARIRATRRRLMERQFRTQRHAHTLISDLKREAGSPAALFLAGEFGFIVGELTKRPHRRPSEPTNGATASATAEASPLQEAVNVGRLLSALSQALPLAWIVDTFYPPSPTPSPRKKVDLSKKPKL